MIAELVILLATVFSFHRYRQYVNSDERMLVPTGTPTAYRFECDTCCATVVQITEPEIVRVDNVISPFDKKICANCVLKLHGDISNG